MVSGIYAIEICGLYYIGSTINFEKRFKRHIRELSSNVHHNVILQRAFNKYGISNVKMFIIEYLDYKKEMILEKEQYYINSYKRDYGKRCCNLSDATFGDTKTGHPDRENIIKRTTDSLIVYYSNMTEDERKIKYGNNGPKNGMYKKTHSIEIKQKLSMLASQRTGDKNSFYGKKHTEETKRLIAEKNKGRNPTNRIPIIVNEKIYQSFQDASNELGIAATTVRRRCLSKNVKFEHYRII
jgi:group I intron endonuclease